MDRGVWQDTIHGVAESDTTEQLHFLAEKARTYYFMFYFVNVVC